MLHETLNTADIAVFTTAHIVRVVCTYNPVKRKCVSVYLGSTLEDAMFVWVPGIMYKGKAVSVISK